MTANTTQTRETVLAVLGNLTSFRWRGVDAREIPVHFIRDRVSVALPAAAYPIDVQIKLKGKFQFQMTQRGAHAFLDFVEDWRGLDTKLDNGFN